MSSLLIVKALPVAAVQQQYSTAQSLANLLTPDPKEVWAGTGGVGTYVFDVDMGAAVSIDFFFFGFLSSAQAYFHSVQTATGMGSGLGAILGTRFAGGALPVKGRRIHNPIWLSAPATSRYWRFMGTFPDAAAIHFGILGLGKAIQPAFGREWGSGRQPLDMSSVSGLRGGGFSIERGARKAAFQFTCGDLTDAETEELWEMAEDVGESAPVIVCEDPDKTAGLNERLHYGLFDRPEAYERQLPGLTRWSFRLRGWV